MSYAVSVVIAEARVLLNDPTGAIYQDTPMLGVVKKVYRELQTRLRAYGISSTKEVSATVPVVAGTVALSEGGGLPTDMIAPIWVGERPQGSASTVQFEEMDEGEFEPEQTLDTNLRFWEWREDEIKFLGASTNREVKIRYFKSLSPITTTASTIAIIDSESWMAQRAASVASLVLGSNPTRAASLQSDLTDIWDDFIAGAVRRKQAIPVRRRRTRYRVL